MSGCVFRPLFHVDSLSLWDRADFHAGSGVVDPGANDGFVRFDSFPDLVRGSGRHRIATQVLDDGRSSEDMWWC